MRIVKLISALAVVMAFSAVAGATASAAETLWRWLPGSVGETFKGEVKPGVLKVEGLAVTIKCAKGKILLAGSELVKEGSTEGKDATLGLATIHFEGCKTSLGMAVNSAGDLPEIVLAHVELHNCVIKTGEFGLLVLPLVVTLEIPSVALTITILEKGLFIAKIASEQESKLNYLLTAKQEGGIQKPEKCEGGETETLLAKVDNEVAKKSTIEFEALIEFDMTKDVNGEELMI